MSDISRFPDRKYEAFVITEVNGPQIQGRTIDGKVREFELVIHRNLLTNELTIDVIPHYTSVDSESWFDGSEPWEPSERLGQD